MVDNQEREIYVTKAVDDFGGVLQDYRLRHNLSLQDMAELIGCSSSYVWRIENNKRNPEAMFRMKILFEVMHWQIEDLYLYLEKIVAQED